MKVVPATSTSLGVRPPPNPADEKASVSSAGTKPLPYGISAFGSVKTGKNVVVKPAEQDIVTGATIQLIVTITAI